MTVPPNPITAPNAGGRGPFAIRMSRAARVGEFLRSLRHEVAFGTAWRDESPDQALRVAAGFHGSMRRSGWGRVAPTGRGVKPSR